MKTIILGRTGNQPFKIDDDADGVSRQHAQITITDNNEWDLLMVHILENRIREK